MHVVVAYLLITTGTVGVIMDGSDGGVADGAVDVSTHPLIVLKFTTEMNATTLNGSNVTLSPALAKTNSAKNKTTLGSGSIPITQIIANSDNTTFYFSSVNKSASNTQYTVNLTSNIKSAGGVAIKAISFSFTTGDFTAPTVGIVSPANGAINIARTPAITLIFGETVQNVNSTHVTLRTGSVALR